MDPKIKPEVNMQYPKSLFKIETKQIESQHRKPKLHFQKRSLMRNQPNNQAFIGVDDIDWTQRNRDQTLLAQNVDTYKMSK